MTRQTTARVLYWTGNLIGFGGYVCLFSVFHRLPVHLWLPLSVVAAWFGAVVLGLVLKVVAIRLDHTVRPRFLARHFPLGEPW